MFWVCLMHHTIVMTILLGENSLRQSIAYLKQALEEGEIIGYSWIQGEEIIADVFTKQGLKQDALGEIMNQNKFEHAQT